VLDPAAPVDVAAVEAPPGEAFVAQRGARLFHARDCGWVRRISEPERVYFKRVAEAKEAGLQPCPSCEPWEPA
jgi:methylphosphotriester-DNA--protein-cysteine methyltransferase